MKESFKYSTLARRSGVAGIVILVSWCIATLAHFTLVDNVIWAYLMRLAQCLVVVLPIPAILTGFWSIRSLNWKDHSKDIGYAVFGIISGILSIIGILLLVGYLAGHL